MLQPPLLLEIPCPDFHKICQVSLTSFVVPYNLRSLLTQLRVGPRTPDRLANLNRDPPAATSDQKQHLRIRDQHALRLKAVCDTDKGRTNSLHIEGVVPGHVQPQCDTNLAQVDLMFGGQLLNNLLHLRTRLHDVFSFGNKKRTCATISASPLQLRSTFC
jgi:hypothetical protein